MLDVPLSSEVDGHVLQVPVSDNTAKVLNEVLEDLHEEIAKRCARRGVNVLATLVPTWHRVVTVDEIRTLAYSHER
jgi:hypothetical protein